MKTKTFTRSYLASFVTIVLSLPAVASVVRNDVDYQYFRDFAENKGPFSVGSMNIDIKDNNGQLVGTMLHNLPMVDFSAMVRGGYSTLIAPQYLVSVAHNTGYKNVQFGAAGYNPDSHHYTYKIVDRNDYEKVQGGLHPDYHTPRLNKLVTEVVPAAVTNAGTSIKPYLNEERFPMFLRAGSGTQALRGKESNKTTGIAGAYEYLTGGTTLQLSKSSPDHWLDYSSNLYQVSYGPLSTYALPGDSGSGSYAYDMNEKRWVLVGVLNFYNGMDNQFNRSAIIRKDFHEKKFAEDIAGTINNTVQNAQFNWTAQGKSSSLSQSNNVQKLNVDLKDSSIANQNTSLPQENHGKTINFNGKDATIVLKQDIDQGAGALNLNANLTIRPETDQTWQGAGIIVGKDKKVNWQVKNPQGDRLSKLGEGTLYVNGRGQNLGDISVGDGIVILNQQADHQGRKQAFNTVGIVSGRPTVVLGSADQVNPDNIYFGFRGGRLDLNGNSIAFKRIQNSDKHARIVNHNRDHISTLIIQGQDPLTSNDLIWGKWASNSPADIYEYTNPYQNKRKDYFRLKGNSRVYYPTNATSNDHWEFLSSNREQAIQKILDAKNLRQRYDTFNGFIGEDASNKTNGILNVVFDTKTEVNTEQDKLKNIYTMSGGFNLNGELTLKGGTLLLSGHPTPHAYDIKNKHDVVRENDWQDSHFTAKNITVNKMAQLYIGRNVNEVNSHFTATDKAKLNLGFINRSTPSCYDSEYTGTTHCEVQAVISDNIFANLATTAIKGNVKLQNHSQLNLGKANLTGSVQADQTTHITLANHSHWLNNGTSQIGHLTMEKGSILSLNDKFATTEIPVRFNKMIIQGNLKGNGRINYTANLAKGESDHLQVDGIAEGNFVLAVRNSTTEANPKSSLNLLSLKNSNQEGNKASISLENNYVDLGTYRYVLENRNHNYYLFNPLIPNSTSKEMNATSVSSIPKKESVTNVPTLDKKETEQNLTQLQKDFSAHQLENQKAKQSMINAQSELRRLNSQLNVLQKYVNSRRLGYYTQQAVLEQISIIQNKIKQTQTIFNDANATVKLTDQKLEEAKLALGSVNDLVLIKASAPAMQATNQDTSMMNIIQADWISQYANTALSELSAQANSALQISNSLDRQLFKQSDKFNVWSSVEHQKTEHKSDLYRPYKQQTNLTQLGIQMPIDNGLMFGVALSKNHANAEFNEGVNGKSNLLMASLYGKWQSQQGTFISLDGSYGKAKNQLYLFGENHFTRRISSIGANIGHQFDLAGVQIQPTIGARYYHFSGQDYTLGGAKISSPNTHFMTYQAGLKASKTFSLDDWKVEPSITTHYVDASNKRLAVNVNNNNINQRFGRYLKTEAGIRFEHNQWQFDLHAGFINGNEIKKQHFAGVKLGYSW